MITHQHLKVETQSKLSTLSWFVRNPGQTFIYSILKHIIKFLKLFCGMVVLYCAWLTKGNQYMVIDCIIALIELKRLKWPKLIYQRITVFCG